MFVSLAACSAPQGKKMAVSNNGLAPVAAGPDGSDVSVVPPHPGVMLPEIDMNNQGQIIGLNPNKTLTVTLPSSNRDGYSWRLAEIPDPTVLKMVSQEFIPGPDLRTPGQQKIVFEGTGVGEVPVKMWYGTLWASDMNATRPFEFTAAVTPEEVKKTAGKSAKKSKKAPSHAAPAKHDNAVVAKKNEA